MREHRRVVRDNLLRVVRDGGPGWDTYAKSEAAKYTKEDPTLHEGLVEAVNETIRQRDAERKPQRKEQ